MSYSQTVGGISSVQWQKVEESEGYNCFFIIFSSPEPLAHWWAYSIAMIRRRPPVVIRRPPFSKNFSKTAMPIKAKFHMEPQWNGGTKVCSRGLGHMTKMAAMVKALQKSSSPEPKGQWPCGLVCSIEDSGPSYFVQIMTLGWPWPILQQGQIWSLIF